MKRETIFSPCRKYRYTLWRQWDGDLFPDSAMTRQNEYVQFIALNPSIADETQDDPTVRRCIDFAKRWGFGALSMTNAFAWRDTDPNGMLAQEKPVSHIMRRQIFGARVLVDVEENDYWIDRMAHGAGMVIAAWGKHGRYKGRDEEILSMLTNVHCLRKNEDGTPAHPLYLPSHLTPIPYP